MATVDPQLIAFGGGMIAAGEPFYVREALNVDDPVALLSRSMNIYS